MSDKRMKLVPRRRVITYTDAEGVERSMEDDWWEVERDGIHAIGVTPEAAMGMFDRIAARRGAA